MKCKDCKHWQGNKYSTTGDCYRLIGKLQPHLYACYLSDEEGRETYFSTPFDPHDFANWQKNGLFVRLVNKMTAEWIEGEEDFSIDIEKAVCMVDDEYGFRQKKSKIMFIRTGRNYECGGDNGEH